MRVRSSVTAVLFIIASAAACSDDTVTTGTASTNSTGGQGGSGQGASGGMGQGGSGGELEVQCGQDITFTSHFSCDVNALTSFVEEDAVTIGYGFDGAEFIYEPKCVHICAGTEVTFEPIDGTDFNIHPLQGGAPPGDPNSPFGYVLGDHQTESFVLTEAGSFPYYCDAHLSANMVGAIYVQ